MASRRPASASSTDASAGVPLASGELVRAAHPSSSAAAAPAAMVSTGPIASLWRGGRGLAESTAGDTGTGVRDSAKSASRRSDRWRKSTTVIGPPDVSGSPGSSPFGAKSAIQCDQDWSFRSSRPTRVAGIRPSRHVRIGASGSWFGRSSSA